MDERENSPALDVHASRAANQWSAATLRALPLPSLEQHRAFVQHVRNAHSWYKHLPLLEGGQFAVFLAPDAGQEYPTRHPLLPLGNTQQGYRDAFGYLSYAWSVDGGPFYRDGGGRDWRAPAFEDDWRFVLYPYVSDEFYWSVHEDAVARLRAGAAHPDRERVLAWYEAEQALARAEGGDADVPSQMRLSHEAGLLAAPLRIGQVQRIEQALQRLYRWHAQGDQAGTV